MPRTCVGSDRVRGPLPAPAMLLLRQHVVADEPLGTAAVAPQLAAREQEGAPAPVAACPDDCSDGPAVRVEILDPCIFSHATAATVKSRLLSLCLHSLHG